MKVIQKEKLPNGRRKIKLFGMRVLSYSMKYDQLIKNQKYIINALADPNGFGQIELMLYNAEVAPKYGPIFHNMPADAICLDCGANIGLITDLFLRCGGIVHAFDPLLETARLYARKYANNNRVIFNNAAVSGENGEIMLHTSGLVYDQACSIVDVVGAQSSYSYKVKMMRLVDYIKQFDYIYILKLDIEGAEFDVLDDILQSGVYDKIGYIMVETHVRFNPGKFTQRLKNIEAIIEQRAIKNIFLDWV
ncbi:methyltransferase [Bacteroidia bacterium]|nr:methyltransferase [Bacteroidia bacterium]